MLKTKNLFSVYLFYFYCISKCYSNRAVVDTTHGKVSGKPMKTLIDKKSYYAFKGIPFAAPPINDLRFLPPQPIEPWSHTLSATREKPACIQFNEDLLKGQPYGRFGAEDCLYLDIYTPSLGPNKLPTIVFLHNRNFKSSHNKTKEYGPDFFIEEDTIVVMISHRLSVFGFLSLEDDIVSGNAGLKDIVQGLDWYKKNAVNFGGNPEKITLLGSNGGAAAVDLLIHSKAKEYFSSAIMQSGTSWSSAYLQENVKERAITLSELLQVRSSNTNVLLQNLNLVPVDKLFQHELAANPKEYFREHQRGVLTFGPVVETSANGLILEYPEDYSDNIDIPIMIGYNSREGMEPSFEYLKEPRFIGARNKDPALLMPKRVKFEFVPIYTKYYDAAEEIKKYYFPEGPIGVANLPEYITYIGDVLTAYAVDFAVQHYANKTKNELFYYNFDYVSELNENKNNILKLAKVHDGTWGAATGDELCYLFMCPSLTETYLSLHGNSSETVKIQRTLIKMWTNFAKYGNPTPDDILLGEKWPVYKMETKLYLHIQQHSEVKDNLNKNSVDFWNNWISKWEDLAISSSEANKKDEL